MNRKMLFVLCFVTLFGPSLISSQESVTLGHCHLNCDGYDSLAIEDQSMESQLNDARRKLAETDLQMNNIQSELTETKNDLTETRNNLDETRNNLAETINNLTETRNNLAETRNKLTETRNNLVETRNNLTETRNNLAETRNNLTTANTRLDEAIERLNGVSKRLSLKSCSEFKSSTDAVIDIYPLENPIQPVRVKCDMTTASGGWTVIQSRVNGDQSFNQSWQTYEEGFGDPATNYWIGLKKMNALTKDGNQILRIELTDSTGANGYAEYSTFMIGSSETNYTLTIAGYSGNIGDSIVNTAYSNTNLNNQPFSTFDIDNDNSYGSCASNFGGWWYNSCMRANLNGKYEADGTTWTGIIWYSWHNNMRSSKMMIRRK